MEKYNLNEGNEALNRVLLMMKYDSKKTLTENKIVLVEQSTLSSNEIGDIARKIYSQFLGDVQSTDLNDVREILNNEVFGKTYEKGECVLEKLNKYIKGIKGGQWHDYYTSLGSFSRPSELDLVSHIKNSEESNEPEFNDIKDDLLTLIDKEFKGFCKTKKTDDSKKTGGDENKKQQKKSCPAVTNTGVVYKYEYPGDTTYVYGIKDARYYAKNRKTGIEFKIHDCYPETVKKLNAGKIEIKPKKETENSGKPNVVVTDNKINVAQKTSDEDTLVDNQGDASATIGL